jgi:hypothetical protein
MYVALIQYPHFVPCVVVGPSVILSLVVPDLAPQKIPFPIQDENGDVSEGAPKGSRWFCKVDAYNSFYAAKWLLCQHLEQTHFL